MVIASMLYVAQFPMLVIFFFGLFAYLLWKAFAKPPRQGIREVFDFYISANEVLRDDERKWFGFEVQEIIGQGERITRQMNGAPPLVFFALGALYNKSGDHSAAVEHLEYVIDDERSDESTYLHPSSELRRYVKVLRKIEREPVEAPQVSAAVRSLERKRRKSIHSILSDSQTKLEAQEEIQRLETAIVEDQNKESESSVFESGQELTPEQPPVTPNRVRPAGSKPGSGDEVRSDEDHRARKPISEVLHDIYDKNIQ